MDHGHELKFQNLFRRLNYGFYSDYEDLKRLSGSPFYPLPLE